MKLVCQNVCTELIQILQREALLWAECDNDSADCTRSRGTSPLFNHYLSHYLSHNLESSRLAPWPFDKVALINSVSLISNFKWYKAYDNCIKEYGNVSQQLLYTVSFPKEAMICSNTQWTVVAHRNGINVLYGDMCTALLRSSTRCIEKGKVSSIKHMLPGWNDSVSDQCAEARDAYVL